MTAPERLYVPCPWGGRMRPDGVQTDAVISSDPGQRYRYVLSRVWEDTTRFPTLPVIMLNPSTADAYDDDPTIRRLIGFARAGFPRDRPQYVGVKVCNLYAWRATDPSELLRSADAGHDVVGAANDKFLRRLVEHAVLVSGRSVPVLCAWGRRKFAAARATAVIEIIRSAGGVPHCLGQNDDGSPKHPLYLAASTVMRPL